MIKVGIIGSTGYAGAELVRILLGHREAKIVWYGSRSYMNKQYKDVYRNMFHLVENICRDDNIKELTEEVDVIFTATPQGYLSEILTKDILEKVKVIDLSADYRIQKADVYEKWYGITHKSKDLIQNAVYGLCEIHRERIKSANLIANPGCYPTCSILSVYPLIQRGYIDPNSLIIDAKSGTSGAGRGAKLDSLYCEVNENIKAYGVNSHRHIPEIEEQLSLGAKEQVTISFTPHLVPMNRGILVTAYAKVKEGITEEQLRKAYEDIYKDEYFIRLLEKGITPETKWVKGSNFVDINIALDERTNRVVIMGAMDNLVKGAAGQAVQNMNLIFGLEETEGLKLVPMFP